MHLFDDYLDIQQGNTFIVAFYDEFEQIVSQNLYMDINH